MPSKCETFSEYCDNSSIHGVNYMSDGKRPFSERSIWIILFLLSIYGCTDLILDSWTKWEESPVLIQYDEVEISNFDVKFPAITICPQMKTRRSVFNFTKAYNDLLENGSSSLDSLTLNRLDILSQVCQIGLFDGHSIGNKTLDDNFIELLKNMSPGNFDDHFCAFSAVHAYCLDLFKEVVTDDGICYEFNNYGLDDPFHRGRLYPVLAPGINTGLNIRMVLNMSDADYICRGPIRGYKVFVHTAGDLVHVSRNYVRFSIKQDVSISVSPSIITTPDSLRKYSPQKRNCLFEDEKKLKYFQFYSEPNCEMECIANYTLAKCGCVRLAMFGLTDHKICAAASIKCYVNAENEVLLNKITQEGQCNCLPSCNSIKYETQISQNIYEFEYLDEDEDTEQISIMIEHCQLNIFMKQKRYLALKRSEFFSQTDLLATCGGLLGLFMGVSILSLFEIIYYLSLRLVCNFRMRRKLLLKKEVSKQKIKALCELFSQYCENSTIHGVNYMSDRARPIIERLAWLVAFLLSVYCCGYLINNSWKQWEENPILINFNEKPTPVWSIPFPSVTICPETKAQKSIFDFKENFLQVMEGLFDELSAENQKYLETMVQICHPDIFLTIFDEWKTNETRIGKDCVDTLKKLAPPMNDVFLSCYFDNEMKDCTKIFTETITDEGVCYTFNIANSDQIFNKKSLHNDYDYLGNDKKFNRWSLDRGYTSEDDFNEFPSRVLGAGNNTGLKLILNSNNNDIDLACRYAAQGFKVIFQTSGELPQVTYTYVPVPRNHEIVLTVKPNMMTTSEDLRRYSPQIRQCFFENEKKLKFFKIYTVQNCEHECLANYTMKKCGCVKFSMPRSSNDSICGVIKTECYIEAYHDYLKEEYLQEVKSKKMGTNFRGISECNCLSTCTSITYDVAEISQSSLGLVAPQGNKTNNESRLAIYFKENKFYALKRSEFFGQTDFLSNCGGLLGLFMGISLLSLFEILYYLTLRLVCNIRIRTRNIRK